MLGLILVVTGCATISGGRRVADYQSWNREAFEESYEAVAAKVDGTLSNPLNVVSAIVEKGSRGKRALRIELQLPTNTRDVLWVHVASSNGERRRLMKGKAKQYILGDYYLIEDDEERRFMAVYLPIGTGEKERTYRLEASLATKSAKVETRRSQLLLVTGSN